MGGVHSWRIHVKREEFLFKSVQTRAGDVPPTRYDEAEIGLSTETP